MKNVLVLGGTGFVGREVCAKLASLQIPLTVATRRAVNARAVQTLPLVTVLECNVHDEAALARALAGCDAVVNLVAILHGTQAEFEHAHVALPQKLVRACKAAGVTSVVHVSALGAAADAPSMYQRSKAQGEAALAASGLAVSVLRPSVIFGAQDSFLNLFAKLQQLLPVMPLAGADTRFQPVWVEDVAQAVVNSLTHRHVVSPLRLDSPHAVDATGRTFEACGPQIFTLRELVQLAGQWSGHPRPVIGLPRGLARLQAQMMELMPGKALMSRDNVDSLQVDNIASGKLPGLSALGITATALEAVAPEYLARGGAVGPRSGLLGLRKTAGRF